MDQPQKILILMSETGGGHVSLAEALREQLQSDYLIRIEDLLPRLLPALYRVMTQQALWLWSSCITSDTPPVARFAHWGILPLIRPRLLTLLESFQPDLVLSVHPLLTHAVKRVLDLHAPRTPFAMLFCDPASTSATWYTDRAAAASFVPTAEVYAQALANGFDLACTRSAGRCAASSLPCSMCRTNRYSPTSIGTRDGTTWT